VSSGTNKKAMLKNRLSARECLEVVRLHWGIENDLFGSLDIHWKEDIVGLGVIREKGY
jgi:predicted transposase YbfD/YdcC